jgi:UPF0271 protein
MKLDVNCDLGEGEPRLRTRALMRWITSANVACGGHAGDARSMQDCARFAKQFEVRLGAHPGLTFGFGRSSAILAAEQLELLLLQQVGTLDRIARTCGVKLHHIKLHGWLYHASESSEALGRCYVLAVKRWWPKVVIYALAGGRVASLARRCGVACWGEAFADRAYRDDGLLVPRDQPNALLDDIRAVVARARALSCSGEVTAVSGRRLRIPAQTICVHSDTPDAVRLVRAVVHALRRRRR